MLKISSSSMQGTMTSLASLAGLGSSVVSERSRSSVFRAKKKRWHCVLLPVCKYSVTTTDFVPEQGNAVSLKSSTKTYGGGKGDDRDAGFLLKPAPKPVLMSSSGSKGEPLSVTWDPASIDGGSSDDDRVENVEERNKMIESLGEVLEKAEKLETTRLSDPGRSRDSRVVNKSTPSNVTTDLGSAKSTKVSKTMKSVWRKGDTVAIAPKVARELSSKPSKPIEKDEIKTGQGGKIEPQATTSFRPSQPPLRPQPKLQAKPSVAPLPVIKKPVILKDVGAVPKSSVIDETDTDSKTAERKPILIDKFASKKRMVDPLISEAVLAPARPGKGPPSGKFKDDYRKKNVPAGGGQRRRMVHDVDIPDDVNVSIPGAAKARKGRKWSKASRKAARLQAAKEAAPVKVEILEIGEEGMLLEELAYNLAIGEGEILGYLYSKGIKPDGVLTIDKDMVKMICKEYDVEVLNADPIKVEERARKKGILDEEDLDKLQDRPPVITIMGHVDHGKVSV